MSVDEWPTVELSNVRRMRVLQRVVPNAQMAEVIIDAPFDRVWTWFSDLERSVPAFDGIVRRLRVRRRAGDELRITSWQGPGGLVPTSFDVLLEPSGWCLMTSRPRFYVVGMCADPVGDAKTHVGVMEASSWWLSRLASADVARHVRGDARRIGKVLGVASVAVDD